MGHLWAPMGARGSSNTIYKEEYRFPIQAILAEIFVLIIFTIGASAEFGSPTNNCAIDFVVKL